MTRKNLIDSLAEQSGLYKNTAAEFLAAFQKVVTNALVNGETVPLDGIGKFMAKDVPERIARNPKTGNQIIIPPRKIIKFKPSGVISDILANKRSVNE